MIWRDYLSLEGRIKIFIAAVHLRERLIHCMSDISAFYNLCNSVRVYIKYVLIIFPVNSNTNQELLFFISHI